MFRKFVSSRGEVGARRSWRGRGFFRVAIRASLGSVSAGLFGWWLYTEYEERYKLPPYESALQPNKSLVCPLIEKTALSHNVSRFRFGLPTKDHALGLKPGVGASHVLAHDEGMMFRPYTPTTMDEKGYFDLVIKKYDGGYFSDRIFHSMNIGDELSFRGPIVTLPYQPNAVDCLCMVAGGTGITPMYQIIRTVLSSSSEGEEEEDRTKLSLLYANASLEDTILKKELDLLMEQFPDRFRVHYVVENNNSSNNNNNNEDGNNKNNISIGTRINASILKDFFPPPTSDQDIAILVCGPDGMTQFLCGDHRKQNRVQNKQRGLLQSLGYNRRQILLFSDLGGITRPAG